MNLVNEPIFRGGPVDDELWWLHRSLLRNPAGQLMRQIRIAGQKKWSGISGTVSFDKDLHEILYPCLIHLCPLTVLNLRMPLRGQHGRIASRGSYLAPRRVSWPCLKLKDTVLVILWLSEMSKSFEFLLAVSKTSKKTKVSKNRMKNSGSLLDDTLRKTADFPSKAAHGPGNGRGASENQRIRAVF